MRFITGIFFLFFGVLFVFVFTPLFIISYDYLHYEILKPASVSYEFDCIIAQKMLLESGASDFSELDFSEINIDGYSVGGYYDHETEEIKIYHQDITTIKHEICHAIQGEENRSYRCGDMVYGIFNGVMLNELECYWKENFIEDSVLIEYGYDIVGEVSNV